MAELGWHLAALDRCQGFARDDPGAEIARPAGRDRSHGPHRCPRRHRNGGLPEPVARGRRRLVLGEAVGRASPEPRRAGLSRRAAVSRSAGAGQSGAAGVGRRLAASARRGRDARCRASVRIVSDLDAGSRRRSTASSSPIPPSSMVSRTESRFECPSTTSACSTSNISPTRSMPTSCGRGPTCGSTGSRTKAPTKSPRRSWPPRTPIRSAPRATNWRRISMSMPICCGARRTC